MMDIPDTTNSRGVEYLDCHWHIVARNGFELISVYKCCWTLPLPLELCHLVTDNIAGVLTFGADGPFCVCVLFYWQVSTEINRAI